MALTQCGAVLLGQLPSNQLHDLRYLLVAHLVVLLQGVHSVSGKKDMEGR